MHSGIYKITNLVNGKIYIGSAVDLKKRRHNHFSDLKKERHPNKILQRSYNKYGLDNFKFEVIEHVEELTELISREQYYIDTLKPYFNICKVAGSQLGFKMSEESRLKMSLKKIGRKVTFSPKHRENISKSQLKSIFQIDISTNEIIKEWISINEARNTLKILNISAVCRNKRLSAGGFNWKYNI